MSVHPGKHKFGKLPLRVLIARQKGHKKATNCKELESEYFQDRIFEMEHEIAKNMRKAYAMKPADLVLTEDIKYKIKMTCMIVAHMKKMKGEEDYKPTVKYYKSYFKKRGLYVGS